MIPDKLVEYLEQSIGQEALVVFGWVKGIKDFVKPVVSITTYNYWPNHANLNVWANTIESRDKITQLLVDALEEVKELGVSIESIQTIDFEERGVLQPGSWKVIKNSKPIFRKNVEVKLF